MVYLFVDIIDLSRDPEEIIIVFSLALLLLFLIHNCNGVTPSTFVTTEPLAPLSNSSLAILYSSFLIAIPSAVPKMGLL